jgi:hypothetical protein
MAATGRARAVRRSSSPKGLGTLFQQKAIQAGGGVTRLVLCLAAAIAAVALAGCGGEAKPTSDEVDAAYLRVAKRARDYTFTIDRATEAPLDRPKQLAREFRSFAGHVKHTATFFLTIRGVGPVSKKALVLEHSLLIYESVLRSVAKLARDPGNGRRLERLFRDVRSMGAEVRMTGAALERALRAAIAD